MINKKLRSKFGIFVLLILLFSIMQFSFVSADSVSGNLFYNPTDAQSKTIDYDESVSLTSTGDATNQNKIIKAELKLVDKNSNQETGIFSKSVSTSFFSDTRDIDSQYFDDIGYTGNYELELYLETEEGDTDTVTKDLTVQEPSDNSEPSVTINSPNQDELLNSKSITAEFDISDDYELKKCEYKLNSQSRQEFDCSKNTLSIDASEGDNTLTIYVNDVFDVSNQDSVDFFVDTTKPEITLQGDNPMTLEVFSDYNEPGYSASDNYDGDLTSEVTVSGSVDTTTLGTYTLTYSVTDSAGNTAEKTREVEVVDNTKPNLTLNGPNPQEVEKGESYTEYGAEAEDNYDGNLTQEVAIDSSEVDTSTLGTYTVYYSVEDSSGNTAEKTRTVEVVEGLRVNVISPNSSQKYYGFVKFVIKTNKNATVEYSIDSGNNTTMSNTYNETFYSGILDVPENVSTGIHEVSFYAEDESGDTKKETVEFNITEGDEEVPLDLVDNRLIIDSFKQPNQTTDNFRNGGGMTDFYGSGDVDGNGKVDYQDGNIISIDLEGETVPNPGYTCRNSADDSTTNCSDICEGTADECLVLDGERNKTLERADVNGDGVITEEDAEMVWEYYFEDDSEWPGGDVTNALPGHWYGTTREQKIDWMNNTVAEISRADDYLWTASEEGFIDVPVCTTYTRQTLINLRGFDSFVNETGQEDTGFFSTRYNQRFNIPSNYVSTNTSDGVSHAINGIYVGPESEKPEDNIVTNFSNWYFTEPQLSHQKVEIGDGSMGEEGYVRIIKPHKNYHAGFTNYIDYDITNGEVSLQDWKHDRTIRKPLMFDNNPPEINISEKLKGAELHENYEIDLDYNIEEGEYLFDHEGYSVFNGSFLDKCYYNLNGRKENIDCYRIYEPNNEIWASLYNHSGTLNLNQTEGKNRLIIYAKDIAGNYRKKIIEWTLDTGPGDVIGFGDAETYEETGKVYTENNYDNVDDVDYNSDSFKEDGFDEEFPEDKIERNSRHTDYIREMREKRNNQDNDWNEDNEENDYSEEGNDLERNRVKDSFSKIKNKVIGLNSDSGNTEDKKGFFRRFLSWLSGLFY